MKKIKDKLKEFSRELRRQEGYDKWITVVVFCFAILILLYSL